MTEYEINDMNHQIKETENFIPIKPKFWDTGNKAIFTIMPFFTILLLLLTITGSKTGIFLFVIILILDIICFPESIKDYKEKMKKYNDIMIDLEGYRAKRIKEIKEYWEKESRNNEIKRESYQSLKKLNIVDNTTKNIPKCPTCGSTDISDISTIKRAVGIVAVGLASSDLGKTKKCNKCGYKW